MNQTDGARHSAFCLATVPSHGERSVLPRAATPVPVAGHSSRLGDPCPSGSDCESALQPPPKDTDSDFPLQANSTATRLSHRAIARMADVAADPRVGRRTPTVSDGRHGDRPLFERANRCKDHRPAILAIALGQQQSTPHRKTGRAAVRPAPSGVSSRTARMVSPRATRRWIGRIFLVRPAALWRSGRAAVRWSPTTGSPDAHFTAR